MFCGGRTCGAFWFWARVPAPAAARPRSATASAAALSTRSEVLLFISDRSPCFLLNSQDCRARRAAPPRPATDFTSRASHAGGDTPLVLAVRVDADDEGAARWQRLRRQVET